MTIVNDTVVEKRNVLFLGDVNYTRLPKEHDSKLRNSTTPSVANCRIWVCSGVVVSITDFLDGQSGQTIRILGDGNTTLVHGATIKTNTAANKLLTANKIYVLTLINDVWYEDA